MVISIVFGAKRFAASIAIKLAVSLVSLTFVILQVLLQTKDLATLVTLKAVTVTHVILQSCF